MVFQPDRVRLRKHLEALTVGSLSHVIRIPVFGVSNHRKWLDVKPSGFRKKRACTIFAAQTKALVEPRS